MPLGRRFGPLEDEEGDDDRKHWRLRSDALRGLVSVSAEELAALSAAAEALEQAGLGERAAGLEALAVKLHAVQRPGARERLEDVIEAQLRAEGLAMRAGPRQQVDTGLLSLLRDAIRACRTVEFDYLSQQTRADEAARPSSLTACSTATAPSWWRAPNGAAKPRLWRLANIKNARLGLEDFERDPDFDLQAFARRSFGTYQEPPVKVQLRFDARAAPDAATFLFHPSRTVEKNEDGTVTVRFEAGGLDEMCWHLITWGEHVTVEQPEELRRRLAEMCEGLAAHHGTPA